MFEIAGGILLAIVILGFVIVFWPLVWRLAAIAVFLGAMFLLWAVLEKAFAQDVAVLHPPATSVPVQRVRTMPATALPATTRGDMPVPSYFRLLPKFPPQPKVGSVKTFTLSEAEARKIVRPVPYPLPLKPWRADDARIVILRMRTVR